MSAQNASEGAKVRSDLMVISRTATLTLATFTGIAMALPVADFWRDVLPSPGTYGDIARAIAVLLSALCVYREVRHDWPISKLTTDIRPSGVWLVLAGSLICLLYIATANASLGEWADLILAAEYVAIMIFLSWGFVRLAKKAYDFASEKVRQAQRWEDMARRTQELQEEVQRPKGKTRRSQKTPYG